MPMTFVTAITKTGGEANITGTTKRNVRADADRRRVQMPLWLLGRLLFGFQGLQIANNHAAAINLDHSLGL